MAVLQAGKVEVDIDVQGVALVGTRHCPAVGTGPAPTSFA